MSKEKIEILKKELEKLSQQRNEVEARDREREEQEQPMQEEWEREKLRLEKKQQQEKLEASRKLNTELEELRKAYFKEQGENLKKAQEHVEKLSKDVQIYERLYQESQERLSNNKLPSKSFEMAEREEFGDVTFWHNSRPPEFAPSEIAKRKKEHSKKLAKYVENLTKDVERYKIGFEATKVELESAKKELLKIESELISRLESAKTAFSKGPEYLKLEDQLKKLDTQKGELYSKMYERVLTTREKFGKLEGERVEKEYQLNLQREKARVELENFKLELGKKLDFKKILAEEFSLAKTEEEREALEKVQKSTEKRIEDLQDEINHYVQIFTPQQEPSSSSSSSSDSSSSLSSSYSSSSSSSSEGMSLKISPSSLSTSDSSSSDSTTSETSPSFSFASSMDLISLASPVSSSLSDGATSEEVHSLGDMSQEGSD